MELYEIIWLLQNNCEINEKKSLIKKLWEKNDKGHIRNI